MENIQRDLEKEIAALQPSKQAWKNKRWTLLVVGDHGKVITIRWFRWMLMMGLFLLVIAVSASGILYYLYRHTRNVNVSLERSLDNIHHQIAGFRKDKEVLMTRLVVAETERERLQERLDPKTVEAAADDRPADSGKQQPNPNSPDDRQRGSAVSGPGEKLMSDDGPAVPAAPENDPPVSIGEFGVSYETASNTFRAQFIIRNNGPDSTPVSGYTAIILKNLDTSPDEWLTLPTLKLAAGVPTGAKKGQYFSIYRFKTVRFMVKSKIDPQQFNTATVYVFDENNELLLEKNIQINIQETVFSPNP